MAGRGTTMRGIRVPDDLWNRVTTHANDTHQTASDVVRTLIETHLPPNVGPEPPTRSGPLG